uniref:Uncharacterized protein HLSG-g29 n=1 Tax=Haemaphysalis longicornis TaxID=44386 RepID=Q4R190_HAELO|nr:hypothetical protein [Haemaphysalis longicornis]
MKATYLLLLLLCLPLFVSCRNHKFKTPQFCRKPRVPGLCRASIPRWGFIPYLGVCMQFVYRGCGGNRNNFSSCQECLFRCAGRLSKRKRCLYLPYTFGAYHKAG